MFPFYNHCISATNSKDIVNCAYCIFASLSYLTFIAILILQLKRRLQSGSKKTSKKCLISYAMIGDFIILLFNQIILDSKYIVEIEPYYRILVFIFVYYYITTKLSKLSTNSQKSKQTLTLITLVMLFIVTVTLIFVVWELTQYTKDFQICQFKYDKISRMIGALVTMILVVSSSKLQSKMDAKIEPHYQDHHPILQIKNFQQNETQREDLRILIIIYCVSQFLTIFQMIYYLVKSVHYIPPQFPNCEACQMMPCLQISAITTQGLELVLKFLFTIIIIFLPYLALIHFFWLRSQKSPKKAVVSMSKDEADLLDDFFLPSPVSQGSSKIYKSDDRNSIIDQINE